MSVDGLTGVTRPLVRPLIFPYIDKVIKRGSMTDTVNITIDRNDLFSLIAATDNYRSHWFDNWLESNSSVDQLVYERVKELCNTIKDQVDEQTKLAA